MKKFIAILLICQIALAFPALASVATPSGADSQTKDASYLEAELRDLMNEYEWKLMQAEDLDASVDNASIYRTAENTSSIITLLYFIAFVLVVGLGVLLASIFCRYFRIY